MDEIFEKLTEYTLALREGLERTNEAHGWSFIVGLRGETIASKWVVFTNAVGIVQ